jgi:putative hydrolase of the HAD superfamily
LASPLLAAINSTRFGDHTRRIEAVETLLLDFGGTLDADGVPWKERFQALYRAEGLDVTAEIFAPAFYAADDSLVGSLPQSANLSETVCELTANLEAEFARSGRNAACADRGLRIASRFLSDASAIFTRNRLALAALRADYRLGVVSNFYGNLEAVCASVDLARFFDVMVDSKRVGAEKPDPAIFRAALAELGADPNTTVFVGDSLGRDGEGARRSGLGFIWVTPQEEGASVQETTSIPVLAAVAALPDLLSVLA